MRCPVRYLLAPFTTLPSGSGKPPNFFLSLKNRFTQETTLKTGQLVTLISSKTRSSSWAFCSHITSELPEARKERSPRSLRLACLVCRSRGEETLVFACLFVCFKYFWMFTWQKNTDLARHKTVKTYGNDCL